MPERCDFGARLRSLREQAGLSVAELAQAAELHPNAIYLLESGQRLPTLETARKLARALGKGLRVWE